MFQTGDDVVSGIADFAEDEGIIAARVQGIGAFTDAELGFFDRDRKDYDRFQVREDHEVLALLGNLSRYQGRPRFHAHATLADAEGTTRGGHLFEAHAGATLEVFVLESPGEFTREDDDVGIPLIRP